MGVSCYFQIKGLRYLDSQPAFGIDPGVADHHYFHGHGNAFLPFFLGWQELGQGGDGLVLVDEEHEVLVPDHFPPLFLADLVFRVFSLAEHTGTFDTSVKSPRVLYFLQKV